MADSHHFSKLQAHYSNERTFLSYVRTAASVLVLGVGLLRFFDDPTTRTLGVITLILGIIILILGIYRFRQERHNIKHEAVDE